VCAWHTALKATWLDLACLYHSGCYQPYVGSLASSLSFNCLLREYPSAQGAQDHRHFFWTRDSCIRLDRFVAAKQYHPQSSGLQNPGALAGCFQESGAPSRTRDDLWDKRKSGEKCAIGGGWVVNECPVKVIFVPMAKHFMYFASAENLQKDRHITSKCAILFLKCITQTGNNNAGMCTAHAKKSFYTLHRPKSKA